MGASNTVQERIRRKKAEFVRIYTESVGSITRVCKKIRINRDTFYEWRRSDAQFRYALEEKQSHFNEEVEDVLLKLIFVDEDPASIRFYLDRRHPAYNPKVRLAQTPRSDITLEDILDRAAERRLAIGLPPTL